MSGSATEIGSQIAPAVGGDLYVLIAEPEGRPVLALLGVDGQPRPGWPMRLPAVSFCWMLLPVDDGSVRVVCQPAGDVSAQLPSIGFAFDADAQPLAGWPVDLPPVCCTVGRVFGRSLLAVALQPHADFDVADRWIVEVAADGSIRHGVDAPFPNCCDQRWSIGPDGMAYGALNEYGGSVEAPKSAQIVALGPDGLQPGYPIELVGLASEPAFDGPGRVHVVVNEGRDRHARVLVFDRDGTPRIESSDLGFEASDTCAGIEGSCEVPAAPMVGSEGTYLVGYNFPGTIVAGVYPSGDGLVGWQHLAEAGRQVFGFCPPTDVCESNHWAMPAIGPGDGIYLPLGADGSGGGSIRAFGSDGEPLRGWPVELTRPGSGFWSVEVGTDGTVFALAVEPESEAADSYSATVLAIDPDSTVLYAATLVEP